MAIVKQVFRSLGDTLNQFQRTGVPNVYFLVPLYRKHGLTADDMVAFKNMWTKYGKAKQYELAEEALQSLTKRERAEREFRINRAIKLYTNREFLPLDQWSTPQNEPFILRSHYGRVREDAKRDAQWRTDNI